MSYSKDTFPHNALESCPKFGVQNNNRHCYCLYLDHRIWNICSYDGQIEHALLLKYSSVVQGFAHQLNIWTLKRTQ